MPVAPSLTTMTSLTGPSEVTVTSDGRIELQPTQSIALKNGAPVEASVVVSATGVVVQTDTVNLAVQFDAGADNPSTPSMLQGASADVVGEGFAPNSPVVTWIQSTPTKLGTATTSLSGAVSDSFTISSTIEPGPHTIQINSVDAQGNVLSIIYGVEVKPAAGSIQPLASSVDTPNALGATWMWWIAIAVFLTLALIAAAAVRRRMRA